MDAAEAPSQLVDTPCTFRSAPHKSLSGSVHLRWALASLIAFSGCGEPKSYPHRPILLVCPWAAGGGTDRVSRTMAAHLEATLGAPVNVINATGGKGVTGHDRALSARPDGYTIGMATLELNMMHWSGLTSLTVDDCLPLMSINEDYAALFVRTDSPWKSLSELEDEIRRNPGKLTSSGTSTGGAWHLALAGWLLAADLQAEDVNWVSSTGAGPSLQELIGGGLDMVCCSLPEASTLLESGQVRALGVMAPKRAQGYEDVATFAEQGTDWSLGGWRALVLPKGTAPEIQATVLAALEKIVQGQTQVDGLSFPDFMDQAGFDRTWRSGDELRVFLEETDRKFGALLTSDAMRSVNQDRFDPMTYPRGIAVLMGLCLVAIAVQSVRSRSEQRVSDDPPFTGRAVLTFCFLLLAIAIYPLLADTVGFVLMSVFILSTLSIWLGVRVPTALAISLLFSAAVYQLFAYALRVPLPRGWLGW